MAEKLDYKNIASIIQKCADTLNERGKNYGDDSFSNAAKIMKGLCFPQHFKGDDIAWMLFGTKLARLNYQTSLSPADQDFEIIDDCIVDACNYIVIAERERRKRCGQL